MSDINSCLTKADLVESVHSSLNIDKIKAAEIIEDLIELVKTSLAEEHKVMISGFGVFEVKSKHARPGRNPQTGGKITLAPRHVVRFKPSQLLRKVLNDAVAEQEPEA
ncbi:MAG: integration host factor subunit alpha [bacterium]|nr:integration host factor subunit alpha [bacterium]